MRTSAHISIGLSLLTIGILLVSSFVFPGVTGTVHLTQFFMSDGGYRSAVLWRQAS